MQAGYRRDRNAERKALKAAVKNSKLSNAIYGFDAKQDAVYKPLAVTKNTTTLDVQTDTTIPPKADSQGRLSTPQTTQATEQITAETRQAISELLARSDKTMDELRTTGSAGPSSTQSTPIQTPSRLAGDRVQAPTGPSSAPPRFVMTPDELSRAQAGLRKTPPSSQQPSPQSQFAKELFAAQGSPSAAKKAAEAAKLQGSVEVKEGEKKQSSRLNPSEEVPKQETLAPAIGAPLPDSKPPSPTGSESNASVISSNTLVSNANTSTTGQQGTTITAPSQSAPSQMGDPNNEKEQPTNTDQSILNREQLKIEMKPIFDHKLVQGNKTVRISIWDKATDSLREDFKLLLNRDEGIVEIVGNSGNKHKSGQTQKRIDDDASNPYTFTTSKGQDITVDVYESMNRAVSRLGAGEVVKLADGRLSGLGIADVKSDRVVYSRTKQNVPIRSNQLFLLLPALIKGHVRLYNKSGKPVVSRSNASPSFLRIAKDIVERNTFEASDYESVDPKESADVNRFIEMTRPVTPANLDRLSNADTLYKLKKRYEVLVGQLAAGNQGEVVKTEMEEILRNLMRMYAIKPDKARSLIKSLREL